MDRNPKPSLLRTVLVLGRTSNLPTVWTNVLAAWFLAGGNWDWQIAWLALAVSALYLGGMTLNDAFDVKWDREHAPERPVPSGLISELGVWMLGWSWMVAGVALALTMTDAGVGWVLALVAAILLYDWIHKKWAGAMWVMGACRALVYLVAASAVAEGRVLVTVGFLAMGLGAYVAGITLFARSERTDRRLGMTKIFASLLLISPFFICLLQLFFRPYHLWLPGQLKFITWWWPFMLLFLGIWWLGCVRLNRNIGQGVTTLLAGIVVVDALFVSLVDWRAAVVCLAFLPIVRWAQRWIPAT